MKKSREGGNKKEREGAGCFGNKRESTLSSGADGRAVFIS